MIRPEGISGVAFGEAADGDPRTERDSAIRVSTELGIPRAWAWLRQVHGARTVVVSEPGVGSEADAHFTVDPVLPLGISTADCLPVAILGDRGVGIAHAGWRGAAAGVVPNLLAAMTDAGISPHTVVIGPGIGACCFEVGPEVLERFPGHRSETTWGTPSVDLGGAVADSIHGVARLVKVSGCTHHEARFHSYRRDATAHRQFGVAWHALD